MLHCLLSRRVVNGGVQLPQDRLWWLCEIAQPALHYRNFAHASYPGHTKLGLGMDVCYALLST